MKLRFFPVHQKGDAPYSQLTALNITSHCPSLSATIIITKKNKTVKNFWEERVEGHHFSILHRKTWHSCQATVRYTIQTQAPGKVAAGCSLPNTAYSWTWRSQELDLMSNLWVHPTQDILIQFLPCKQCLPTYPNKHLISAISKLAVLMSSMTSHWT